MWRPTKGVEDDERSEKREKKDLGNGKKRERGTYIGGRKCERRRSGRRGRRRWKGRIEEGVEGEEAEEAGSWNERIEVEEAKGIEME